MKLTIKQDILSEMLELAKETHPKEIILLIKGNRTQDTYNVTEYAFPPYGVGGKGFSAFPIRMLPIDFSMIGTAHSHPSGKLKPSIGDHHNHYGRTMMIMARPYTEKDVAVYSKNGEKIQLKVI
jgi:proteasome lid subunit RPN8/RPN11